MESRNWYVIGYKNGKGKKPRRFDVKRFQETLLKEEALKRLQSAYSFSIVTDVALRREDTKLDEVIETVKDWWWLLSGVALVVGGFAAGVYSHLMWPAVILIGLGVWVAIAFAPRSTV